MEMSLKPYRERDLRFGCQQSIAEAPSRSRKTSAEHDGGTRRAEHSARASGRGILCSPSSRAAFLWQVLTIEEQLLRAVVRQTLGQVAPRVLSFEHEIKREVDQIELVYQVVKLCFSEDNKLRFCGRIVLIRHRLAVLHAASSDEGASLSVCALRLVCL